MSQWTTLSFVPPRNGKPCPDRGVDRAVNLLVEERVPVRAVDPLVAADPELAQAARTLVAVERREQEVLVGLGRRLEDQAVLEAKADSLHLVTAVPAGVLAESDDAVRRVLDWAVEDLARRHVRGAGVDVAVPTGDRERQVGGGADIRTSSAASKRSAIRRIRAPSASQSRRQAP